MRVGNLQPFGRMVGNEVGGDEARPAGRRQIAGEAIDSVAVDEVEVGHDERGRAGAGYGLDHRERVRHAGPALEGQASRLLDHSAVHRRVRVGHADLHDVGPRRHKLLGRSDRTGEVGEADGQIPDECGAAALLGRVDGLPRPGRFRLFLHSVSPLPSMPK